MDDTMSNETLYARAAMQDVKIIDIKDSINKIEASINRLSDKFDKIIEDSFSRDASTRKEMEKRITDHITELENRLNINSGYQSLNSRLDRLEKGIVGTLIIVLGSLTAIGINIIIERIK